MSGTDVATGSYGDLLITAFVVLVATCVAMFVIVRLAGRWLSTGRIGRIGRARGGLLDVVARVPLEARRSLYIVDVAGKALLLGTSELGVTVLSELDRDLVRAAPAPVTFAELVRRAIASRSRRGGEEGDGPSAGTGR